MNRIPILLFFFLITSVVAVRSQDFRFKSYRVEDGLPGDDIKAVTQDQFGFIWIATDDGLVRYNLENT